MCASMTTEGATRINFVYQMVKAVEHVRARMMRQDPVPTLVISLRFRFRSCTEIKQRKATSRSTLR